MNGDVILAANVIGMLCAFIAMGANWLAFMFGYYEESGGRDKFLQRFYLLLLLIFGLAAVPRLFLDLVPYTEKTETKRAAGKSGD